MITDEDLTPIDLSDFWEEDAILTEPAPNPRGIVGDYVDRQIARIPVYGDDSRWRLASHLDMFENLSPDGTLTHAQRQAVDNFVLGYQYQKSSQPTSLEK